VPVVPPGRNVEGVVDDQPPHRDQPPASGRATALVWPGQPVTSAQVRPRRAAPGPALSVSERKRADIRRAALHLFTRDGYERTSVDAIAAEAGVSKRTVYNHYGDKENLFISVVQDTFTAMIGALRDVVDRTMRDRGDVEQSLTEFVREVCRTLLRRPERAALIRLIITEGTRFPVLTEPWRRRGIITDVIAEPLARLGAEGRLDIGNAEEAARHLSALTFGQINGRSLFGVIEIGDAEVDNVITGGVRLFLRAYAPR
jgi:TetR/AcrR family transcriptional regulator, mexJK operon transcriptional repressor